MITRREKTFFPSMLPCDSFCQSPVQQHLFTEQGEESLQAMIPESEARREGAVRSSLCRQRPHGGQGAAAPPADVT